MWLTLQVVFGPSMTALTFHVARSMRDNGMLGPGDNVVLDPISHGANVWPWVRLAKATGAEVLMMRGLGLGASVDGFGGGGSVGWQGDWAGWGREGRRAGVLAERCI